MIHMHIHLNFILVILELLMKMLLELLLLIIGLVTYLHYKKRSQLPPGPFSVPIIGTLVNHKKGNPDSVMSPDYYKYGEMYTLFVGPFTTFVIINDLQLAKDLFSRDEFSGDFHSLYILIPNFRFSQFSFQVFF